MKNIQIKQMNFINFKGVRKLTIDFDKNTNIFGDNGTGKTTVFDGFTWLLFGKDSTDRKDFEIKTLDKNNVVIPQIEHEVSAIIFVDNEEISIRRILKENWVKKRGSLETEFSGNVTDYYWNDVPMQQKEFQLKVNHILDESVFKMITNPLAFNSLKWQDRRSALVQIAGEISDSELASGISEYENLIAQLTQGKTLEDYRKQIAASIKKAKEDLKAIPTRVDEISKSKPEAFDFLKLSVELGNLQFEFDNVEAKILDVNKAFQSQLDAQRSDKLKANNLQGEIQIIEQNARKEADNRLKPDTSVLDGLIKENDNKKSELQSFENGLKTIESKKDGIASQIQSIEKDIEAKRKSWGDVNAGEISFNDNDFHCPTCKREFESGDVEEKKKQAADNFNDKKKTDLLKINTDGKNLATQKANLDLELKTIDVRINNGKESIVLIKKDIQSIVDKIDLENANASTSGPENKTPGEITKAILDKNQKYQELLLELEAMESAFKNEPTVDNEALVEQRKNILKDVEEIKVKLQNEAQIKLVDKRISDLQKEESALAQQIASVEKTQFVIEKFNKLKIDTLEQKINSKFKFVNFKMFQTQINGGEIECCDCLIDGVPFSDANTASKCNAGIDIINTLCEFYQVTAPIFLDNRESVINIIDCDSQIVNLIVWEGSSLNTGNPRVNGILIDGKSGLKLQKELA
ncbi:MAG: AAA family ATPase [Methylotenera sp.]|nr:AAA family ATPase [Flavobacterium sp.]